MWPHRWQPTRLLCPRDSLGKNTGVGCHFLLHREFYSPWNSPGQNTGLGSCFLLQGIFSTQGLNPGLPHCRMIKPKNTGIGSLSLLQGIFPTMELNSGFLHCRWILYQLSYEGSPYFTVIYFIVDILTWFSLLLRHFLVLKMRDINLSFLNLENYTIFVNRKWVSFYFH